MERDAPEGEGVDAILILTRKPDDWLMLRLGDQIVWLKVCGVEGPRVKIGIQADKSVLVLRGELVE